MKKSMAILLVLFAIVIMLCACSESTDNSSGDSSSATTVSADTIAPTTYISLDGYTVVRAENMGQATISAASDMCARLGRLLGKTVRLNTDWVASFDGELTVRENTFLRGAMLGYTRDFMNKKYEEIIDFSGLGEFQDRRFKQLSSGMKSRLAFSIACLVNPDILILDEVLSVGDGAFRKKSERKMTEVIQNGATTLLVSHSLDQIRRMANKVLWLDKGRQIEFGDTKTVCDHYAAFLKEKTK